MTSTKLPKHWDDMASYRCYYRSFGPMTLKVLYSSSSGRFKAMIVAHFDTIIHTLHTEYQLDVGDSDADMLRLFEYQAKTLIRSWAK